MKRRSETAMKLSGNENCNRVPLAQFLQQQFELCKGHTNYSLALICTIIKDIQVSLAIANPNVASSTRLQLSWIWTTHQGIGEIGPTNNHLTECT